MRPQEFQWKKFERSPLYKNGNKLHEYQLEGLNWLTFCWYRRSVNNLYTKGSFSNKISHGSGIFLVITFSTTDWKLECIGKGWYILPCSLQMENTDQRNADFWLLIWFFTWDMKTWIWAYLTHLIPLLCFYTLWFSDVFTEYREIPVTWIRRSCKNV